MSPYAGSTRSQARRLFSRYRFRSLDRGVCLEVVFSRLLSTVDGDDGIRTHDPLLAGQVLSQLSYTPTLFLTHSYFPFNELH